MTSENRVMYIFMRKLTGEQAYMAAMALEGMVHALWRTYGDDMADFQGRVFPDEPSPYGAIYCTKADEDDGGDF